MLLVLRMPLPDDCADSVVGGVERGVVLVPTVTVFAVVSEDSVVTGVAEEVEGAQQGR